MATMITTRFLPSSPLPNCSLKRRTPTRFFLSSSSIFTQSLASSTSTSSTVISTRCSNSNSGNCDWSPSLRVSDIRAEVSRANPECIGDGHHWLVVMDMVGAEVDTEQELFNYYIKTLATVVGSEEAAKKKIYLVSCEWSFGFGAEIEEAIKYELEDCPGVTVVLEDYYYDARNMAYGEHSIPRFTPINRNLRLNDIFSYHHLSERNAEWNYDHWLIHIKQPNDEFGTKQQTINCCIRILAAVVGSEEEAKERIYIVWCKEPFGFGAKIDEETSNNLRGRSDVLVVLPDYAFDVTNKNQGVLVISPSSCLESYGRDIFYRPLIEEYDSDYSDDSNDSEDIENEYCENSMEEPPARSDCKRWFIIMEKPGGKSASTQQRIDCYIRTLAMVVGSEEEAKEKIYRAKCKEHFSGFGAEVDEVTSNKLKGLLGVVAVFPDYLFNKDNEGRSSVTNGNKVQSFLKFFAMDLRDWRVEHLPQPTQDESKYINRH